MFQVCEITTGDNGRGRKAACKTRPSLARNAYSATTPGAERAQRRRRRPRAFALAGGVTLFILCLGQIAGVMAAEDDPPADRSMSPAEHRLQSLVQKERAMLEAAERPDGSYDEEQLEPRYQDLVDQYDVFLDEHPEFPAGYVAFARVLERIGREKAARAMYLKANELDPNIPLVKNQLGNFLTEEGHFDQALPYYLAAIELEPDEPLYHYQLGNLLHHFRDAFVEEAIFSRQVLDEKMLEAFGTAARLSPENIAFTYRHAEAYYDLEDPDWEEALDRWEDLREKVKPGIERQTVDLHKANIALKQGNTSTARRLLASIDAPALKENRDQLRQTLEAQEGEQER